MNLTADILLAVAVLGASATWIAVAGGLRRLEYFGKPATMAALAAMALAVVPHSNVERLFFVAALLLGLAGDVLLMLPRDYLVAGLLAFLLGHLAYIAGFRLLPFDVLTAAGAMILVVAGATVMLGRYIAGLRRSGRSRLVAPVVLYAVVISGTVISAAGSRNGVAFAGALLFYLSDALFAWYRFVGPLRWGRPVNIALYQTGQALLALSLAAG
jgi:uncharacterized membrane protein YhhN